MRGGDRKFEKRYSKIGEKQTRMELQFFFICFSLPRKKEAKIVDMHQRQMCQKIYEENVERIRWYLWRKFEWLNPEDAHDIMQDVWKVLSEDIEEVGDWPPVAQYKWLETVAHNKVINLMRRGTKAAEIEEGMQLEYSHTKNTHSAEEAAIEKVTAETILEKLSDEDKKTIFNSYLQSDTPKTLKKKNNAEVCKLYRAKKKLKKAMKEGGMDE